MHILIFALLLLSGGARAADWNDWDAKNMRVHNALQLPVTGALKGNGANAPVTQAGCADLANAAASCATDATNAGNVTYTPNGAGAVARSLLSKAREGVSITDFGAVANANNTTALQAAATYANTIKGGTVTIPPGLVSSVTSPILLSTATWIKGPCAGNPSGAFPCSALRAGANIPAIISQPDTSSSSANLLGLFHVSIDGRRGTYSVDNLVDVNTTGSYVVESTFKNGSGNCIRQRPDNVSSWIDWYRDNTISECTGAGLYFEGAGSHIYGNYFTSLGGAAVQTHATAEAVFALNHIELSGEGIAVKPNSLNNAHAGSWVGNWLINQKGLDIHFYDQEVDDSYDHMALTIAGTTLTNYVGVKWDSGAKGGNISGMTFAYPRIVTNATYPTASACDFCFDGDSNTGVQIIGSWHTRLPADSRFLNLPKDAQVISSGKPAGGVYGGFNRLQSLILQDPDLASITKADAILNVYGAQTVKLPTLTSSVKAGGNIGNGTLAFSTLPRDVSTVLYGTYTVRVTATAANGGTLTVTDPNGVSLGTVDVGAAYDGPIKFTVSDGTVDFAMGDGFDVLVQGQTGTMARFAGNRDTAGADVSMLVQSSGTRLYLNFLDGEKTGLLSANLRYQGKDRIILNTTGTTIHSDDAALAFVVRSGIPSAIVYNEAHLKNSAGAWVSAQRVTTFLDTLTAGAEDSSIVVSNRRAGALTEALRIDKSGNLRLNGASAGTNAAKIIALPNGTAPTTSPANTMQMWSDNGVFATRSAAGVVSRLGAASLLGGSLTIGSTAAATASAGELALAKIAASATAPGAGFLKVSAVAGTNAGTCKIIAYAGTSATPVTIADNIGSGC